VRARLGGVRARARARARVRAKVRAKVRARARVRVQPTFAPLGLTVEARNHLVRVRVRVRA
jgi:hypothetical protein